MKDLKTPKGTRDYTATECKILSTILNNFIKVFELHGSVSIDTPMFELKELLVNKYGDDSKLIFDLADQGGEICSLRYDLTVSFARFLATCTEMSIKRYQIGKVFRRDNISINKGRLREFIQCDFDIASKSEPMFADAECILVAKECLDTLGLKYKIKINSRTMLSTILKLCEIPDEMFLTVCSSIDKLDKMKPSCVKSELQKKGCEEDQIEKIFNYLNKKNGDDEFEDEKFKKEFESLHLLMEYLKIFGVDTACEIDLSLARGLDYYTGVIFEAVLLENTEVGSIAGGGRYDNLVSSIFNSNKDIPCVGFSLGVNRILSVLIEKNVCKSPENATVFVVGSGGTLVLERMKVLKILWDNKISAESYYNGKQRFGDAKKMATKRGIKNLLVVGEIEFNENKFKLMYGENYSELKCGSIEELVEFLKCMN